MLKTVLEKGVESSAAELAYKAKTQLGVNRTDITAQHAEPVYQSMPKLSVAADFSLIDDIAIGNNKQAALSADVTGVIVETREHHALEAVILNVHKRCKIPIQLFHGTNNLKFILSTKIADLIERGDVLLTPISANALDARAYNALFLSPKFWEAMLGRKKILVFQTDSLCCLNSPFDLNGFLHFDYIGSLWGFYRPVRLRIAGGSGGFSLRDWAKSVNCLDKFPADRWGGGEDGYFAFHLDLIGDKVASIDEAAKFSTQDRFLYHSFAAHGLRALNTSDRSAFILYCPEAKEIFPALWPQET